MSLGRVDPRFRLIEGQACWSRDDLAVLADRLEPAMRKAAGLVTVAPGPVAVLIAALYAAQAADVPLFAERQPGNVRPGNVRPGGVTPAGLRVEADGAMRGHGSADCADGTGPGFAVVLATSGTTGTPKLARHDLNRLTGRLRPTTADARWLLSYDPASFAGLQVILTALVSGATLIAEPGADAAALAHLAARYRATHISGTPSFWRAVLLAGAEPPLQAITLGGEAADQATLDRLRAAFPQARLRHVYASTEAGALFAVGDGRAGFPAAWLDSGIDGVGLRVRDGTLEVRSPRAMLGYAAGPAGLPSATMTQDGWLITGDQVKVVGDRVLFAGRADGIVNIGGVKVAPEVVETLLLAVPGVAEAAVTAVPSPITGHVLTARIVLMPGADPPEAVEAAVRTRIRDALGELPPAARPRLVQRVDSIGLTAAGKKQRRAT